MIDILKIFGKVILWIIIGFIVLIGFIGIISFMGGIGKRYVIHDGSSSHWTDSYEERDGCIYFTDHLDYKNKICGYYTIRERELNK